MRWPLVLRSTFDKLDRENDRLLHDNANLRGSNKGLMEQLAETKDQLKKAQKNDHRDQHGRFVKAED